MPSGRTHDVISLAVAPPVFLIARHYFPATWMIPGLAAAAAVFAGLMFGPDLDIKSKPARRWGPLGFIWWPYRFALRHRSRLSHGLILGTVFRLLYFVAVTAALGATVFYLKQRLVNGAAASWTSEFQRVSLDIGQIWRSVEPEYFWAIFAGLWIGAAAHTLTDLIVTILKKTWKML